MPSRQVEIVERAIELYNRLDHDPQVRGASPEVQELVDMFDPDAEVVQASELVDRGSSPGHEGVRRTWEDWLGAWLEHRTELVEVVEQGNRVLALSHDRLVGREGLRIENDGATVFTFAGERIVRMELFMGHDAGRRAFAGED